MRLPVISAKNRSTRLSHDELVCLVRQLQGELTEARATIERLETENTRFRKRVAELEDAGLDQIVLLPPLDEKEAVIADVARELIDVPFVS